MDRVRSEDLAAIDATLVGHGAVGRPAIELPADAVRDGGSTTDGPTVPTDEVVRLVLSGSTRHVRFQSFAGGVRATGGFDAPDLARSPGEGENRLREWVEDRDLATGRTVHLDVIQPGCAYGLRAPGESTVYDAVSKPDDSLASIAASLERDGE